MAIYHLSVKTFSRSHGVSMLARASYRSGEKLYDKEDQKLYDQSHKHGKDEIIYTQVYLPNQAKPWWKNREILWNEVQKQETAKNATLAREIQISFPNTWDKQTQIKALDELCGYLKDQGMCVDAAIHDKIRKDESKNFHAHIMCTMRPLDEQGEWAAKSRKVYLDAEGKETDRAHAVKTTKENTVDWGSKKFLYRLREKWEEIENSYLKENEKVSCKSYAERGIPIQPKLYESAKDMRLREQGILTDRAKENDRRKAAKIELLSAIKDQKTAEKKLSTILEANERERKAAASAAAKSKRIASEVQEKLTEGPSLEEQLMQQYEVQQQTARAEVAAQKKKKQATLEQMIKSKGYTYEKREDLRKDQEHLEARVAMRCISAQYKEDLEHMPEKKARALYAERVDHAWRDRKNPVDIFDSDLHMRYSLTLAKVQHHTPAKGAKKRTVSRASGGHRSLLSDAVNVSIQTYEEMQEQVDKSTNDEPEL